MANTVTACPVRSFISGLTLDCTHGFQDKRILESRDLSCSGHRTGERLRWEGATRELRDSLICRTGWRPAALTSSCCICDLGVTAAVIG